MTDWVLKTEKISTNHKEIFLSWSRKLRIIEFHMESSDMCLEIITSLFSGLKSTAKIFIFRQAFVILDYTFLKTPYWNQNDLPDFEKNRSGQQWSSQSQAPSDWYAENLWRQGLGQSPAVGKVQRSWHLRLHWKEQASGARLPDQCWANKKKWGVSKSHQQMNFRKWIGTK